MKYSPQYDINLVNPLLFRFSDVTMETKYRKNRKVEAWTFPAFLAIMVFIVAGCATTPQGDYSGFLDSYPELEKTEGGHGALTYIREGVDWDAYEGIIIDPVQTILDSDSDESEISSEELQELTTFFREAILREIEERDLQVVEETGPGVLRMRVAITFLKPGDLAAYSIGWVPFISYASSAKQLATGAAFGVGEAMIEAEILDANSGRRLAVIIDREVGAKINVSGGVTKWGHVERAFEKWAKRFPGYLTGEVETDNINEDEGLE